MLFISFPLCVYIETDTEPLMFFRLFIRDNFHVSRQCGSQEMCVLEKDCYCSMYTNSKYHHVSLDFVYPTTSCTIVHNAQGFVRSSVYVERQWVNCAKHPLSASFRLMRCKVSEWYVWSVVITSRHTDDGHKVFGPICVVCLRWSCCCCCCCS